MEDNESFSEPDFDDSHWDTFSVPDLWNDVVKNNYGYMWLRAKIHFEKKNSITIFLERASSAYTLYANGSILFSRGNPGTNEADFVPLKLPALTPLPPSQEIVLAWKISNFIDFDGGPTSAPTLGISNSIYQFIFFPFALNAVFIGIFFIIALQYIFLWMKQKKDKSFLFLSLFALLIIVQNNIFQYGLQQFVFPANIFPFMYISENLSLSILTVILIRFYKSLYPEEIKDSIMKFFTILIVVFHLVYPSFIDTVSTIIIYINITIVTFIIIWLSHSLLMAVKHKQEQAKPILAGLLLFGTCCLLSFWFSPMINTSMPWLSLGYVILIVINSFVLSRRFSKALNLAADLSRNLEKEVKRQTLELAGKTAMLQDMDKQKTLFYQNITHELRTPLTLIIGNLESIAAKPEYKDSVFSHELEYINRSAKKLYHLINQLLDLTKIDFNAMDIKPVLFHFPHFIRQLVDNFTSSLQSKNIHLICEIQPEIKQVYLDMQKVEDIITNLLSNAFKFTDEGGSIALNVYLLEKKSGFSIRNRFFAIEIIDTGIGIPKQELPYIFQRFRQVDGTTTRKYEGTGIGLSLAQEYVKMHGGSIEVVSAPGEGSCFSVYLPLSYGNPDSQDIQDIADIDSYHFMDLETSYLRIQNTPQKASFSTEKVPAASKALSILVVEDNKELLQFMESNLSPFYNIYTADNGLSALQILEKNPLFDLIISDIMMPEMDGYEFYRSLKHNAAFQHIPFMFITAKVSLDDKLAGLEEGAVDYITKPFSIKTLLAKIKSLLRFSKLKGAMYERERLASLGKLISAVSHEILNPLAGMTGPVYHLQKLLNNIDEANRQDYGKALDYLRDNINRIDSIIKNIRSLNRYGVAETKTQPLVSLVQNTLILLKNKITETITVKIQISEDLSITVNPGALSHILLNLVSNACDALDTGGEIIIRAEKSPQGIVLEVEDTGSGIKKKDLPRIFDLYFTTKNYNEGSGFGLYFVKDLVVKMGWTIEVESQVGRGTVFRLCEGED